MTTRRLARTPRRQAGTDDPTEWQQPDPPAPSGKLRICCHGETVAPTQRQFQFRNLTDDPRLNLRLAGILTPTQGTS